MKCMKSQRKCCIAYIKDQDGDDTSGTHAQAHATKTVRGEGVGREEGAKVGSGRAGRGG